MDVSKLISLVQNYTELYNMRHPEYFNVNRRENCWEEIGAMLGQAGSDKERWVKIRDCHRKALQRRRTKSGQAAKKIKPPRYEKELAFLVPYLVDDDQRTSNFAPSVNSTEDKAGGIDENEEEVLNDTEDSYPASLSTSPLLVNTTKSVPLNTSSTLSPGNVS
ncbi:uncharacterized protein LOC124369353 [Homalodisca vitripennis]|uniref:uncharacterized protein LOC124369353 n=1 Tax=Homalodisca vitripennis TaxID=197043 RepID=UPI001EEB7182|nr:uncharacterized protein LOC124369353 [Homalodisca vitripennis]